MFLTSRASARGTPIANTLKVANWSLKGAFEGATAGMEALITIQELSYHQSTLAGMLCALNVPLVSIVPCIYPEPPECNSQKPRGQSLQERMDCMRRWKIQGTV